MEAARQGICASPLLPPTHTSSTLPLPPFLYLLSNFFSQDGDGIKDKDDTDSDGDGISDAQESGAQTSTLNSMTKNCKLQAYHDAELAWMCGWGCR